MVNGEIGIAGFVIAAVGLAMRGIGVAEPYTGDDRLNPQPIAGIQKFTAPH
jgi:hypothetical protein